jgi:hypothetical protein
MTDFSLKFYNRLAMKANTESRYLYTENRSEYFFAVHKTSLISDFFKDYLEDKDSLSVRVEFIKVNISRSRRLLSPNTSSDKFNDVRLSVLADIGRASFIYDMRNIKEVFVFPKIWYRRSLARRLFLGEEPSSNQFQSNFNSNRNSQSPPPTSAHTNIPQSSPQQDDLLPLLSNSRVQNRSFEQQNNQKRKRTHQNESADKSVHHSNNPSNWQTLVLVSINLSELEVKMNVGNVMGHVG